MCTLSFESTYPQESRAQAASRKENLGPVQKWKLVCNKTWLKSYGTILNLVDIWNHNGPLYSDVASSKKLSRKETMLGIETQQYEGSFLPEVGGYKWKAVYHPHPRTLGGTGDSRGVAVLYRQ